MKSLTRPYYRRKFGFDSEIEMTTMGILITSPSINSLRYKEGMHILRSALLL